MKLLVIVIVCFCGIFLALMATGITDVAEDFRTDLLTETYNGDTTSGSINATLQLSHPLWKETVSDMVVRTDVSSDVPYAHNYNSTTREIVVSGLTANQTREITLTYKTAGLSDYEGGEEIATKIPLFIMLMVIMIPVLALIFVVVSILRRR